MAAHYIIPELWRPRQEDPEFGASLGELLRSLVQTSGRTGSREGCCNDKQGGGRQAEPTLLGYIWKENKRSEISGDGLSRLRQPLHTGSQGMAGGRMN